MTGHGMLQLVHDLADMGNSANISRDGVKALSLEIRRLQAVEQAAQVVPGLLSGVLPDRPWPHTHVPEVLP